MNWQRAAHQVAVVLFGQGALQFLGILTGLYLVRALSVEEYALYTIANTCIAMATVLADSGLIGGTTALAGERWKEPQKVADVLLTATAYRKQLSAISIVIGLGLFFLMALRIDAPTSHLVPLAIALAGVIYLTVAWQMAEIPLRLAADISFLQRIALRSVGARFVFTVALVSTLATAASAIWVALAVQAWWVYSLSKRANPATSAQGTMDSEVQAQLQRVFRRALPMSLYFTLSGQITYLLVAMFASTSDVAGLGAIGRFTVIFSVTAAALNYVVIPWFARQAISDAWRLKQYYLFCLAVYGGLVAFTALAMVLSTDFLLLILGPAYQDQGWPFVLSMLSGAMGAIAGAAYHLGAARNYIPNPLVNVTLSIGVQAIAIATSDLQTLEGVITLGFIVNIGSLLICMLSFLFGAKPNKNESLLLV